MKSRRDVYVNAGFNTDSYKKTFWSPWVYFEYDESGLAVNNGGFYVEWKPKSNLLVSAGPFVNFDHSDAQYVTTVPDPSATRTFGNYYVFAELDQKTVGVDLRVNWTFTPNLSLETYVQPYISSGQYSQYKSLAAPDTYSFDPYAYGGNPSFDYRSLRGNAVIRWEYLPGSTLFLVWTQQREDYQPYEGLDFRHDMRQMFDAQADNVFMVKVTYHLGI
jgi:hypothetical protein